MPNNFLIGELNENSSNEKTCRGMPALFDPRGFRLKTKAIYNILNKAIQAE